MVRYQEGIEMDSYDRMTWEARELALWMENEPAYYRWIEQVNRNMARYWVKGVYDKDRGIRAYRCPVDSAARQYHLEHGTMTTKWSDVFTVKDREQVAEFMADTFASIVRQPAVWGDLGEQAAKVLAKSA